MVMPERIAPYILAGGRSTRMGRDKAMIPIAGKTLLARAVETLQAMPSLHTVGTATRITVVGDRTLLEGADRSIPDRYPGCGPLGGIEAALNDLKETRAADWAMFFPVDMPFLPPGLVNALLTEWAAAAERDGVRVCYAVVDRRPQPLVSLIHRELHPFLATALQMGQFRVTPVLESACKEMADAHAMALPSGHPRLLQTVIETYRSSRIDKAWIPTEAQQRSRHLWFANLNSQTDLSNSETFSSEPGSMSKQAAVPD